MNKPIVVSVIFLILIGIAVSRVKYEVVFLRKTLKTLTTETDKCIDNIKILEAEWSYLHNPERLKNLANKYLPEMKPVGVKQVMLYNKIISSDLVATEDNTVTALKNGLKADKNQSIRPRKKSSFDTLLDKAMGGN